MTDLSFSLAGRNDPPELLIARRNGPSEFLIGRLNGPSEFLIGRRNDPPEHLVGRWNDRPELPLDGKMTPLDSHLGIGMIPMSISLGGGTTT
jgi:hypothetical protein